MTDPSKNIVIVDGGFGGSTVARELRARLPDSHMLILISEESYLTFNPLLPEVLGASIFHRREDLIKDQSRIGDWCREISC